MGWMGCPAILAVLSGLRIKASSSLAIQRIGQDMGSLASDDWPCKSTGPDGKLTLQAKLALFGGIQHFLPLNARKFGHPVRRRFSKGHDMLDWQAPSLERIRHQR